MCQVRRLEVTASLDDPAPALARARTEAEAGDESWQQWLAEYEAGQALVVRLDVRLWPDGPGAEAILRTSDGVFVERDRDPPKIEQQIAELASQDFAATATELRARGYQVDVLDLTEMYVHVELDPELEQTLMA